VHCLLGVCDSLAEAHASGLIHRDIKPSNIFLCRRGLRHDCVKVLDFGLVTAATGAAAQESWKTASTQVAGTPAYMPPEIVEGGEVDGRADLYALGCVAYFLLSGRTVFESDSATAVVLQHLSEDPPPLRTKATQPVPAALEQLVHSCLEKNPARRPRSAAELRRLLQAVELESAWTEDAASAWWETMRRPEKLAAAPIDPSAVTASAPPTMREGPPR
jgi:serine/threonine-protein kinase